MPFNLFRNQSYWLPLLTPTRSHTVCCLTIVHTGYHRSPTSSHHAHSNAVCSRAVTRTTPLASHSLWFSRQQLICSCVVRKVQAVQATHDGARNAAVKLKQRNDALGAEERQRTAEEEAQIARYGEHMSQYKCAMHDEVLPIRLSVPLS